MVEGLFKFILFDLLLPFGIVAALLAVVITILAIVITIVLKGKK